MPISLFPPSAETKTKHVIAIASGKGGVGKSTLTVLLAHALRQRGYRAGIMDCDVYGPSIPTMLGNIDKPQTTPDKKMIPPMGHGIAFISMGLMVDLTNPIIWRGPMVSKAIQQMFFGVAWPKLDILLLDLPPGTGDAQLTLVQKISLTGAIVVSTSQDIALQDAIKGAKMFQKTGIEVIGFIENMSLFSCPHCHQTTPVFDHGRVKGQADALGIPFLGSIPLLPEIRCWMDHGIAPAQQDMDPSIHAIAHHVVKKLWP